MGVVFEAQDVSKRFLLRHNRAGSVKERFLGLLNRRRRETTEDFWALQHISMSVSRGESVGLIGRNGSGKSTFLKIVAGIHRATTGRLLVQSGARIGSMIELGLGFNAELTGAENLFLNAAVHGLSRSEIEGIYDRVVAYAGLPQFMDVPLKNFSSGMTMRLGFSIAVHLAPDVLLLDEIFAVGDADFQQQCSATMQQFREQGRTIVFVSHSPAAVKTMCRRVCLLERGELLFDGAVERGLGEYQKLLTASTASRGRPRARGPSGPAGDEPGLHPTPWHRAVHGGHWEEGGVWQYEFLEREGLKPHHFVLDVGCGSLAGGLHLLQYMDQHRYWGVETDRALFEAGVTIELPAVGVAPEGGHFVINDAFDLSEVPMRFNWAMANSLFTRLSLNQIARVIVEVTRQLDQGGRFYATWFDNADPRSLEPIERTGGLVTHPDAEPYHYSFGVLANLCEALGLRAERLAEAHHPRGESVMVITRT